MNTVRKHLSAIQGGRLAAASRAPTLALIVSDVTGDDPTHIASGPCAPDPTTYADALSLLERHAVRAPQGVIKHLTQGANGHIAETPKPGDKLFQRVENRIIGCAQQSLEAAAEFFRQNNIQPALLGDSVTGEAREVAKVYGALARQVRTHGNPWQTPVALISGGECTVTVRGKGRGGRCAEFLLALAIDLDTLSGVSALACDTDGIDGSEDNAGAFLAVDALSRAAAKKLNPQQLLDDNNAHAFFATIDALVITGPTRTNVNDYRVILVQ
jgi:hydroxypyruvate reductase